MKKAYNKIMPSNKLERHHKTFTQEEDDFLTIHYGSKSIDWLATRLQRTPIGVHKRARYLKLGTIEENLEALNANQLSQLFGVSNNKIRGLMERDNLPYDTVRYHAKRSGVKSDRRRKYIRIQKFWVWYKDNLDKLPIDKYEMGSIIPEPEWVRDAKLNAKPNKKYTEWSQEDERILREGIKNGDTYSEIAERLDRTYHSVVGRLRRYS